MLVKPIVLIALAVCLVPSMAFSDELDYREAQFQQLERLEKQREETLLYPGDENKLQVRCQTGYAFVEVNGRKAFLETYPLTVLCVDQDGKKRKE